MKRIIFLFLVFSTVLSYSQGGQLEVAYPMVEGTFNTCSGTLYDSGGLDGNYSNNENITMTICPDVEGRFIRLDFTSFLLVNNEDYLTVYDGRDVSAPDFAGGVTGSTLPLPVTATASNESGCLTVVFRSDGENVAPGFVAKISCEEACQEIVSRLVSTTPAFSREIEPVCIGDIGVIRSCVGEQVSFSADANFSVSSVGAKYIWDFGNGTKGEGKDAVTTYESPGTYKVNLIVEDANGCFSMNSLNLSVQISTNTTDFKLNSDNEEYCVGDVAVLESEVKIKPFDFVPPQPFAGITFLPDGRGEKYTTTITVDQYCIGQTLPQASDIKICLNLEHSYSGDLEINIIAPNGTNINLFNRTGSSNFFGHPVDVDSDMTAGRGETYCFTPLAAATIDRTQTVPTSVNTPGVTYPSGDYLPVGGAAAFDALLGTPLNGQWTIEVIDHLASDNGYIFWWGIEFSEDLAPADLSFEPSVVQKRWLPVPGLTTDEAGVTTFQPDLPGEYELFFEVVDNFNCTHVSPEPLKLLFTSPPIVNQARNLSICKDDNGNATFNLNDVNTSVTSNSIYSFSYFFSEADAIANTNLTSPNQTVNIADSPKEMWVRVFIPTEIEEDGEIILVDDSSCFAVEPFKLIVNDCKLILAELQDLQLCESENPNDNLFNLDEQTPLVYFNTPGYIVTYYTLQDGALQNENEISDEDKVSFTGTDGMTIYVRVQNETNPLEFATTSFQLRIFKKPVLNPLPPIVGCVIAENKTSGQFNLSLNNSALTGGLSNLEVTYYSTELEAENADINSVLPNNFVSENTTIWARVRDIETGCYSLISLDLIIANLPQTNDDVVVDYCNNGTDEIGEFSLDTISQLVLGTAVTPSIVISYHITEADANANVSALPNPYRNNTVGEETIYARIAYVRSDCYTVVPVLLRVSEKPRIVQPTALEVCVDSSNREVIYDLTTKIPEILGGLNQSNYNITFHVQRAHAEQGILSFTNPASFSNIISNIVWVRVENRATGCYSVVSISLRTIFNPNIPEQIPTYSICDNDEDGFAIFDLYSKIPSIVNNQMGMIVSFHVNFDEAEQNINPLERNYQNIVASDQGIFVRIENANGCAVIRPMNLKVYTQPVLNIPSTPVAICRSGVSGQGTFDLISLVDDLQNGVEVLQINFYETRSNAEEDVNRIPNPNNYNNINPNNPVVWVRGLNVVSGCFVVKPLNLKVVSAPSVPIDLEPIVDCAIEENSTSTMFDLTEKTQVVLTYQTEEYNNSTNLVVTYHISENAAFQGIDHISNPSAYTSVSSPQTIWIRVFNTETNCFGIGNFEIIVKTPLQLKQPDSIIGCEQPQPSGVSGSVSFDLTQREIQILGGELIYGTEFSYYVSKTDAENDINKIENPSSFINDQNPQTIWIVVTNMDGCKSTITLTLRVTPLPKPNMNPKDYVLCEGEPNTGIAQFDLTTRELDISNHDDNLFFEYYESEEDAEQGNNMIEFPTFYPSRSANIWVKVFNQPIQEEERCFVIVKLSLKVDPLPVFGPLTPFLICEENTDGFNEFDLTEKYDEILRGRDINNYNIYFYLSKKLADVGDTTPLHLIYTNIIEEDQTIWVRLENKETGCFYVAPLRLKIEEKIEAFDIATEMVFCDDNDGVNPINDGFTRINLTVNNSDIIGIQKIADADLKVDYFASEEDLRLNTPIAQPAVFVNTSNPQTIIAVVSHKSDDFLCSAEIRFEVFVHKKPELLPIEGGYICENLELREITPFVIDTRLDPNLFEFIWELNGNILEGANQSYYEAFLPGDYTVRTIDKKTTCESFNSITVEINKIGAFMIVIDEFNGDLDVMSETGSQTITVSVEGVSSNAYEYALNDGGYSTNNVFTGVESGEHVVWVRDLQTGACAVSKIISVMNYPKFFTPNGDGYNDTWNVKGLKDQPNAKIYVFDRFGKLLKQLSPLGEGWDGTFEGRPMPSTDYWFTVEYYNYEGNQQKFKGHFSLKR